MKHPHGFAFIAGALVSGILGYASVAGAWKLPGSACAANTADTVVYGPQGAAPVGTASPIVCPYIEESTLKSDISNLYIDIYDSTSSAQVTAQVCSQPWDGSSIHCGGVVTDGSASVTGNTSIASVSVSLPSVSKLYGISNF
jgi:hypothetical protein